MILNDADGEANVVIDGGSANFRAGGHGQDGDVELFTGKDVRTIRLDAQVARVSLGSSSLDGDLRLESTGGGTIRLDAGHADAWPAWPNGSSASTIDLLAEIKLLKEKVIALEAKVAALSPP